MRRMKEATVLKDNLRRYREKRGLSQQQLADELHVVRQTVSKWERGTSVPDADLLVALAQAFDVTPNELLGDSVPTVVDAASLALEAGLLKEKISQQDRMERIYRRTMMVVAVACAIVFIGATVILIGNEVGRFADGFEQGFKLQGTWQAAQEDDTSTIASFGFSEDDGGVWQLADFSEEAPVTGYFKTTDDPNMYLLQNEYGEEVGWAHVAYTSTFGGKIDGLAYVQYRDRCYRVKRVEDLVGHYARDFASVTSTMVDRYRELKEEGVEGADVWLKEWFTE